MSDHTKGGGGQPGNGNAVTHGLYQYLKDGTLPADLTGLDAQIAAEIMQQAGDNDRFNLISKAAARAFLVNEILFRHFIAEHKADPDKVPGSLKIYGSYQESLRRMLAELQMTPASAAKAKEGDIVTAREILEQAKQSTANESNESNTSTD